VGFCDGADVPGVGAAEGLLEGALVIGAWVGLEVLGVDEGSELGFWEGNELGSDEGLSEGASVTGDSVGESVTGNSVGAPLTGAAVGPDGHVVSVPHIASVYV